MLCNCPHPSFYWEKQTHLETLTFDTLLNIQLLITFFPSASQCFFLAHLHFHSISMFSICTADPYISWAISESSLKAENFWSSWCYFSIHSGESSPISPGNRPECRFCQLKRGGRRLGEMQFRETLRLRALPKLQSIRLEVVANMFGRSLTCCYVTTFTAHWWHGLVYSVLGNSIKSLLKVERKVQKQLTMIKLSWNQNLQQFGDKSQRS